MRPFLIVPLSFAMPLVGQNASFEKPAMNQIKSGAWLSILGTWDHAGRPQIRDLAFMSRWNPDLFVQRGNKHQMEVKGANGATELFGVEVARDSEGEKETWTAHIPLVEPYVSYKILGPGRKVQPGWLEGEGDEAPKLRIWEEGRSQFRWEVSDGWQIQVDATVDEGGSWALLGTGKTGAADLKTIAADRPAVVRIQAFRGLRCFVDIYLPGKGILDRPGFYLQPASFQTQKGRGVMSAYPCFEFTPGVDADLERSGYSGKVKVRWDWEGLPFDVAKLFPKKGIQMVFQAEWVNAPLPKERLPYFRFAQSLLRNPSNSNGLMLHRVVANGNGWKIEEMQKMSVQDSKGLEPKVSGIEKMKIPLNGDIGFSTYWVVTSD